MQHGRTRLRTALHLVSSALSLNITVAPPAGPAAPLPCAGFRSRGGGGGGGGGYRGHGSGPSMTGANAIPVNRRY